MKHSDKGEPPIESENDMSDYKMVKVMSHFKYEWKIGYINVSFSCSRY